MPAKSKPFDISTMRRAAEYRWCELAREGRDPLRARVRSLSIGEVERIPYSKDTQFQEAFQAIAPYVVEWNLTAENLTTGKEEDVPAPAEAGWETLTLLNHAEAIWIINQVRHGHLFQTDAEGKASRPSGITRVLPNGHDSAAATA